MRKKARRKKSAPEWKRVRKLVGDLKAVKRLIKYAEKMETTDHARTILIGDLKMLGYRISHEAAEAVLVWEEKAEKEQSL